MEKQEAKQGNQNVENIPYSKKSINLDWLEVFCNENEPKSAAYFKNLGWQVQEREYGTPLYKEMFTLLSNNGKPFLEVRRNPYSLKENGGIFERGSCHIRLSNRTLYTHNPIQQLQDFLIKYQYTYKGITRLDIACDMVTFDNQMRPAELISKYMRGEVLKVNNSRLSAHGNESQGNKIWNSLKWGSENSPISTKLYDKTKELKEKSDKLYIKDAWLHDGLCELQKVNYTYYNKKTKQKEQRSKMLVVTTGTATKEEIPIEQAQEEKIYRIEYSIKSEGRNWITLDEDQRLTITLNKFSNKTKLMLMFMILSKWCFRFVNAEYTRSGMPKRKDRSKDIPLLTQRNIEKTFKPHRITEKEDPTRTEKIIYNRLIMLSKSDDVRLKLTQTDKQKIGEVADMLSIRHGDFWVTDEERQRIKQAKAQIAQDTNQEQVLLDYFESLDWIERWDKGIMSNREKSYIKRFKIQNCQLLVKRAEQRKQDAEQTLAKAERDIRYWSGQSMEPHTKQIIYDLPF